MTMRRASSTTTTTTQGPPLEAPTLEGELRDLAGVIVRALGLVLHFWEMTPDRYPPAHPYRVAAGTIVNYLKRRYLIP